MKKLVTYFLNFYRRGPEERTQVHIMLGFVAIPLLVLLPFCIYVFFGL